jgi:hypothetical protein
VKSSTYLNWFRRLLLLGAVVAGIAAPAAGAVLETRDSGSVAGTQSTSLGVADDGTLLSRASAAYQSSAGAASELSPVDRIIAQERGRHADLGLFGTQSPSHATQGFSLGVPVEYLAQPAPSSGGNGFDWADWGIGIGSGVGIMLVLAGGLAGGMQRRHRVQTA